MIGLFFIIYFFFLFVVVACLPLGDDNVKEPQGQGNDTNIKRHKR